MTLVNLVNSDSHNPVNNGINHLSPGADFVHPRYNPRYVLTSKYCMIQTIVNPLMKPGDEYNRYKGGPKGR